MAYKIVINKKVKRDFSRIDITQRIFIQESLREFAENFSAEYERRLLQQGKIKKLKGMGEILYRLRLRTYRVIYKKEEDRLLILVLSVSTREGAYR